MPFQRNTHSHRQTETPPTKPASRKRHCQWYAATWHRAKSDFSIPVAVVIHRGASEIDYLTETPQNSTSIKIQEAFDKMPVSSSIITIAPADYHRLVDDAHISLLVDPPVEHARPSIDVLLESIVDAYGVLALGVILTGG